MEMKLKLEGPRTLDNGAIVNITVPVLATINLQGTDTVAKLAAEIDKMIKELPTTTGLRIVEGPVISSIKKAP